MPQHTLFAAAFPVAVLLLSSIVGANTTPESVDASESVAPGRTEETLEFFGVSLGPGLQLLLAFVLELGIIAAYHQLVAKGKKGDWFETHAFANALTVLFTLPSMYAWALKPLEVVGYTPQNAPPPIFCSGWYTPAILFHENNHWAILFVVAVHTYHCLAFPLSKQDIFHHLMFVPTVGVYGGFFVEWGPVRNCVAFFISGLPGGIDYAVLVGVKRGSISKLFQKRLASKINLWCRGPFLGMLLPYTCYLACALGYVKGFSNCAKVMAIALLCCYNGIYYMEMAIRNYQMHLTTTKLNKKHELEMQAKIDNYDANYYEKKENQSRQVAGVDNAAKSVVKIIRALSMGKDLQSLEHVDLNPELSKKDA